MRKIFSRLTSLVRQNRKAIIADASRKNNLPDIPRLDVAQLRADLITVFRDPAKGSVLKQKYRTLFPYNLSIIDAFKDVAAYRQNPKKWNEIKDWHDGPEAEVDRSITSHMHVINRRDQEIRTGRLQIKGEDFRHSRGRHKATTREMKAENSRRKRNKRIVSEEVARAIKSLPLKQRTRAREVADVLYNRFVVSDLLSWVGGVKTKGILGLTDMKKISRNDISTLSMDEARDVAQFINLLTTEVSLHEKQPTPRNILNALFDSQYQNFLVLRQTMSREEAMRRTANQIRKQKLLTA